MTFRHYTICQDTEGATVEVWRGNDEVACLAFDNQQHCFVELHVAIAPPERTRAAASFQHLVQLAASLRHRHLLGLLEGGEDEGSNYHITPFLDGERLDSWLARCHPLPPWLALLVVRQLVEGLATLASHPQLLAGVEVFHAGLTLTGPHPDDLTVKICDLGLSGTHPVSSDPQFVEARAIHETGRLLHYMLTGSLLESPAPVPAGRTIPAELTFLLNTILQANRPHHSRTLEQLRTLTEHCLHDLPLEHTGRPDVLPPQYRPRLPLAALLPDGPAAAELLSNDFTLDTRPPDAADPYRYRGTERATRRAVNVQLLPPANLIPPELLLPALEAARTTLSGQNDPHLLTLLAFHPESPAPLLVEELPGKFTLDSLRRLRAPLEPAEVHLLLTKVDQAATAAETRGLPLHWRCPKLIPIHFSGPGGEEALPPPGQLARRSLTDWPDFTVKLRTWPVMLDFTQPDRFQLERLLPRDPALAGASPRLTHPPATTAPSPRDFALLALWLLGGSAHLKENLKPLLFAAISTRSPALASRGEFLTRFHEAAASVTVEPVTLPKSKAKTPGKTGKVPGRATRPLPAAEPIQLPLPATPDGPLLPPLDQPDEDSEVPAMGFAEALFRAKTDPDPMAGRQPAHAHPLWPAPADHEAQDFPLYQPDYPSHDLPDGAPLGLMEAAGQSAAWDPDPESDLHDHASQKATSRWMLVLIVILIAAALAALMAQLSGQAIWLRNVGG